MRLRNGAALGAYGAGGNDVCCEAREAIDAEHAQAAKSFALITDFCDGVFRSQRH